MQVSGSSVAIGRDQITASTSGSTSQLPASAPSQHSTIDIGLPTEVLKVLSDLKTLYKSKLSRVTPFPWMGKRSLCDLKQHFCTLHLVTQPSKRNVSLQEREKTPLKLCDIFNPHEDVLPSRILVDGKAGYGKTSLCAKLAADWSQGEGYIANRFKGVFLIQARNIKDDSLETYFSKNLPKPNNAKQLMNYIGENQDKFVFIIDGLDEVVHSLPDDWIDLIIGHQFISSCVLVTSRTNHWQDKLTNSGVTLENLLQVFDKEIVNNGFTLETAFQFIGSQSQAEHAVEGSESLRQFILRHEFLFDLVHSPLMCMFLCFIWKEGYFSVSIEEQEFRRTHLYLAMINSLVKRFCKEAKQEEYHRLIKNEFSPKVLGKLVQIYQVAYHSLLEGKVQFSLKDITRYLDDSSIDENDIMFSFGILVKEKEFNLNNCEEEAIYVFPHRTVQEELVSEHYLKMPEEERAAAAEQIVREFPLVAIFSSGLIYQRRLDPKLAIPLFTELAKTFSCSNIHQNNYIAMECVFECKYQEQLANIVVDSMPKTVEVYSGLPVVIFALLVCCTKDNCLSRNVLLKNVGSDQFSYIKMPLNKISQMFEKGILESIQLINLKFVDSINSNQSKSAEWETLAEALKVNTALTQLNLSDCEIADRGWEALAGALKTNTSLTQLSLCGSKLTTRGWEALAGSLKTNTSLVLLNVMRCQLTIREWEVFAGALKTNTAIKQLNLSLCNIGDGGWEALVGALKTNTAVTQLDLSCCAITDMESEALAGALKTNTALAQLDLGGFKITDRGLEALAGALKTNTVLTQLNLSQCKLSDRGWEALAGAMITNTSLIHLRLSFCEITNRGWKALAGALGLRTNTTLTQLSLAFCEFGNRGWEALAKALKTNTAITQLDLRSIPNPVNFLNPETTRTSLSEQDVWCYDSKFSDTGWEALAEVLRTNIALKQLNLGGCMITNKGCDALAGALKTNTPLTQLDLEDSKIADRGWEALAGALKTNTSLNQLNLRLCVITDKGSKALAGALRSNTALTILYLCRCVITDRGLETLAGALKTNTVLTGLDLSGCELSDRGWEALAGALKTNTALTHLVLGHASPKLGRFVGIFENETPLERCDIFKSETSDILAGIFKFFAALEQRVLLIAADRGELVAHH